MKRLRAAEWIVQRVHEHGEVVRFLRQHHYAHGAANTSTYRHGLYPIVQDPFVGDLAGVALWIPPTRTAAESIAGTNWQGVLSLSRLAVVPDAPPNAASFLLGRSMKLIDRDLWPWLLTYADTAQGHTGAIYRATNWECWGEVAAGDVWLGINGDQRGRKRGGRTWTRNEMFSAGYEPLPSLPKIKFVHRPKGGRGGGRTHTSLRTRGP